MASLMALFLASSKSTTYSTMAFVFFTEASIRQHFMRVDTNSVPFCSFLGIPFNPVLFAYGRIGSRHQLPYHSTCWPISIVKTFSYSCIMPFIGPC